MALDIIKIDTKIDINTIEYFKSDFIFFHGEALDPRGDGALKIIEQSKISKSIAFIPDTNQLMINKDETIIFGYELSKYINSFDVKKVLIDSTTLSIAEILLILHSINQLKDESSSIKILYLEPIEYTGKKSRNNKTHLDYELSSNLEGYYNIRPFNLLIDTTNPSEKAEVIILLGFEDHRLGRIIKFDENQKYDSYIPLLGLPAFQAGWENITLMKNIRHFNSAFKDIEFVGANNPYQTKAVLEKIYANSDYDNLLIAALGTKPCAIGAAVFLVNEYTEKSNNVGVIYDFPKKRKNRTKGVAKAYIYTLKYSH